MRVDPHPVARRRGIAALEAFVAAGAVYGGVNLLSDAEAFGMRESWLAGTPFPDYTVPGLVLLLGIGGGMATAAVLAPGDTASRISPPSRWAGRCWPSSRSRPRCSATAVPCR